MKSILVVTSEIGGTEAIVPVVSLLKKAGHDVRIVVDPHSEGIKLLGGLTYEIYDGDQFEKGSCPDLVLIATAITACHAQVEATKAFKGQCPVAWLEHVWGAASVPAVQGITITPDFLFADHEASPDWQDCEVIVTGKPVKDIEATEQIVERICVILQAN